MGHDGRYGRVTTERKGIPDDEPVFVIRAQDALACPLISAYFELCAGHGASAAHQRAVEEAYTRFADWQEAHAGQVRLPEDVQVEWAARKTGVRRPAPEEEAVASFSLAEVADAALNRAEHLAHVVNDVQSSDLVNALRRRWAELAGEAL